jgi:hypothetical protein
MDRGDDQVRKFEFNVTGVHFLKQCRAISAASATNELIALRDDPRNHTIPILEYIKFEEQVLAVIPRHVIFLSV